jgi:integrase
MSEDEAYRFLGAIRESSDPLRWRDGALFATYVMTGLRREEALTLRLCDYDPVGKNLAVLGKGGRWRWSPMPNQLVKQYEAYLATEISTRRGRYLFPGGSGTEQLTNRQVNHRFVKWRSLSGIRGQLTVHSLSRVWKNVFEAGSGRRNGRESGAYTGVREHFETDFDTPETTQIVFPRPVGLGSP